MHKHTLRHTNTHTHNILSTPPSAVKRVCSHAVGSVPHDQPTVCVCVCVCFRGCIGTLGASPWGLNSCFRSENVALLVAGGLAHTHGHKHTCTRAHTISYIRSELAVAAVVKQNVLDYFSIQYGA